MALVVRKFCVVYISSLQVQSLQVSSFCVVNSRKMRNSDIIQPYSEALKRAFTIEIQFIIQRKNKSSACRVTQTDFGMGGTHGGDRGLMGGIGA